MLDQSSHQVEQSQTQWLTANHDLSYELEKALYQNKLLKAEMARLKEQVMMLELEKKHPHIPGPVRAPLPSPSRTSIGAKQHSMK